MENDIVKLDVGGCLYTTSRSTLTRFPGSMLSAMFSGRVPTARDETGRYVIDSDGQIFRFVLNFLRRSKLSLPEDFKDWDLLATEADFYQIKELIDAVKSLEMQRKAQRTLDMHEIEYIEIGQSNTKRGYYYLGGRDTLEQIPLLLGLFMQSYEYEPKVQLFGGRNTPKDVLSNIESCGRLEMTRVCPPGEHERNMFEENRLNIFKQISQLGFKMLKREPYLFLRTGGGN